MGPVALLFLIGAAFSAAEDIEDLMMLNVNNNGDPMPYGLIEAKEHVRFWLHAKGHEGFQLININKESSDRSTRDNSWFDPAKKTKVIIHGWMVSGDHAFCKNTRQAYLQHHDYNLITVDWSSLASYRFYPMSVAAIYYVGPYVGEMLDYLVEEYGISLSDVHIIGHSLGAHIAGLAGQAVTQGPVGRITGLDPAGPPFFIMVKSKKLSDDDATLVDVIHTSFVGHSGELGHVDFYPNGGGLTQPGCSGDIALCTHRRAHQLFTESIASKESFPAIICDDWISFLANNCTTEPEQINMGEHLTHQARGVYYLATNAKPPYSKDI